jgi:bacteriocin biosynthesis cyclodehydratase domain-containing protein
MAKFKLSENWEIKQEVDSLIVNGGADAIYKIDTENKESFFGMLKHSQIFDRNKLTGEDIRVFEELVLAEVIVPVIKKEKEFKLKFIGDSKKHAKISDKNIYIVADNNYDLAIITKSVSNLDELIRSIDYQNIKKPHLLVDNSLNHTISIGPLVFPGDTACIACLQGRVSVRWGDNIPPPKSRILAEYVDLFNEIVMAEIKRIISGDTTLTNKTVSWNIQARKITNNQLLMVPLCPICSSNKIDSKGKFNILSWNESISESI